jgi:outer membrane protein assembly factor BamB
MIVPAKDGKVYALNRTTGSVSWTAAVDAGISSPAVSGDTIFVGGGAFGASGRVVALSAITGSLEWSFSPNGPVQASPTLASGHLIFSTNTAHGTVYSLNAATGVPEWSFEPTPADYILGSPVVAAGIVYAPSDNGHVYALGQPFETAPLFDATGLAVVGGSIAVAAIAIAVAAFVILRRRSRRVP